MVHRYNVRPKPNRWSGKYRDLRNDKIPRNFIPEFIIKILNLMSATNAQACFAINLIKVLKTAIEVMAVAKYFFTDIKIKMKLPVIVVKNFVECHFGIDSSTDLAKC